MSQEPKWLDGLSAADAPEVPHAVITAVRARRRQRRLHTAGSLAAVALAAAIVTWAIGRPQPRRGPLPAHLAQTPGTSAKPALPPADPGVIALVYGIARDSDLDRLASASPAGGELSLRIGDRWDLDRVKAWVLE
jgi:hypothetical protein